MKGIHGLLTAILITGFILHVQAGDPIKMTPFHSIVVSSEIVAEIFPSDKESIIASFKNAEEKDLVIEVVDSVLKVRMKTGNYKSASLKVRIGYITIPQYLEASGRAQIWSAGEIHQDRNLKVKVNNGGEIRLTLFCDSLSASLTQGSLIHLKGKTRALQVKSVTNATFSGYEFASETADVQVNSTGKAKVSVSEYLNAVAASKGFIGYIGEPEKVDEKTSMKGEILKTVLE